MWLVSSIDFSKLDGFRCCGAATLLKSAAGRPGVHRNMVEVAPEPPGCIDSCGPDLVGASIFLGFDLPGASILVELTPWVHRLFGIWPAGCIDSSGPDSMGASIYGILACRVHRFLWT